MTTLPATTVQEVEERLRNAGLLNPTEHLPRTLVGEVKLNLAQRTFLINEARNLHAQLRQKEDIRTADACLRAEEKRQRRNEKRLKDART